MTARYVVSFYLFFLLILLGCSRDIEPSSVQSYDKLSDWYPTAIGFWAEYKVDTTHYLLDFGDSIVRTTVSSGYFREEIIDTLTDFDTPYQYRMLTQYRKDISSLWSFYRYRSILPTSSTILKNEENLKYVKLQYPIREGFSWKGNRYLDSSQSTGFQDWNYTYSEVKKPYQVGALSFDTTLTVVQIADSNAIEKKYSIEVYAKGVGLIYSEWAILEKQNGANPWTMPENGYVIRRQIVNWKR